MFVCVNVTNYCPFNCTPMKAKTSLHCSRRVS